MRFASTNLQGALTGAVKFHYVADVFYDGVRVLQNLPITSPSFDDNATSLIQSTGSFTCVYQGAFADSIAPKDVGDVLAPFGSQVVVSVIVTCGPGLTERVQLGVYEISDVPSIITKPWLFNTALLSKGDIIQVTLADLFTQTQRDEFDVPGGPVSLTSGYAELQRLTGLPMTRTVPDGPIPASVAYQQDRLQAVYDVANQALDAVPYITPDGTLSMRPNVWPATVATLKGGDGGGLVSVDRSLSNSSVYNKVVVRSYADSGSAVLASAEIKQGRLRTQNRDGSRSPYGRAPYFYSSQYVTTSVEAQAYADKWLPRVSKLRSVQVVLTELFHPLRELGDVIDVQRITSGQIAEEFTGRVVNIHRDDNATQTTTVQVTSNG